MLALCLATLLATNNPLSGASWLTIPGPKLERSQWIWVQKPGDPIITQQGAAPGTAHFTKDWNLPANPTSASVEFTADNSCRININGKTVGSSKSWRSLVKLEIDKTLHAGLNHIEVDAVNDKDQQVVNPAGVILTIRAKMPNGLMVSLCTDKSWSSPEGATKVIGSFDTAPWHLTQPDEPCPIFRKPLTIDEQPKKATLHIVGLGRYDLFVDGVRQDDSYINGPWSQFDKTIYYRDFDLTKSLTKGNHVIAVVMGNSFYRIGYVLPGRYTRGQFDFSRGRPYMLAAALDVTDGTGTHKALKTDKTWLWKTGPYTFSNELAGEDYDARIMNDGWMKPGYKGSAWKSPVIFPAPHVAVKPMTWPAIEAKQSWKPTAIYQPSKTTWTYVFPQNAMAVLRFHVHGARGAKFKLKPSEVMTNDHVVRQLNLSGEASGIYTLKGGSEESHEWRFFYHGFRYVELSGAVPAGKPNPQHLPVLDSLEMIHVRTDNPVVGSFQTSSDLYNKTLNLVDWAVKSNMSYVMTDCPTREKLGWLECSHLLFSTFTYGYDTKDWFRKICGDIRDIQEPSGKITTVAPRYLDIPEDDPFNFTVEWGAAGVLVPWQAYQWWGDKSFLTENYSMMKRYVDYVGAHGKDGLAPVGLGDWYDFDPSGYFGPSHFTPTDLTSTAMWAMCADAVAQSAKVLGKKDDVRKYQALHNTIQEAFLAAFYDPGKKELKNSGSVQTGHAMALCANLIPLQDRGAVLNKIVEELKTRKYQQTPGDVGQLFFIRALAEAGRSDVLHKVYSRTAPGSYGGILAKGMTTLPESWTASTIQGNSLNHCMLGHVVEWFYGWILGIRQAPGSVGWKQVMIAPEPGDLTWARGKTMTPRGSLAVSWKKFGWKYVITADIPKGTTATVVMPKAVGRLEVDGVGINTSDGPFGRTQVTVGPGHHVIHPTGMKLK